MNQSNDNDAVLELPVTTMSVISQQQQSNQHRQVLRLARGLTHQESLENFDFSNSQDLSPTAATITTVYQQQQEQKKESDNKIKNISDSTTATGANGSPPTTATSNNSTTATPPILLSDHHRPSHVYEQKQQQLQKRKQQKNYQIFAGRNKFFCDGRLMTSREYGAFTVTLILLIAPCVLFAVFTCPFLWKEIHPCIPIVFAYVFILALVSMIKTSWSDPGIIPRDLDIPTTADNNNNNNNSSNSINSDILLPKEIRIKDMSWTLKYCDTCRIYRPPRASHCRQCDNCVENEDHHCIWLNNCIGKRNYRSFFVCILTSTILCLYIIAFCLVHILAVVQEDGSDLSFAYMFSRAPVSFVLAIVCFLLLFMVGGLTLYHCSLIMRGVTTHEQLRAHIMKAKDYPSNPYISDSPLINITRVLCQPQPKSYLGRRKFVD